MGSNHRLLTCKAAGTPVIAVGLNGNHYDSEHPSLTLDVRRKLPGGPGQMPPPRPDGTRSMGCLEHSGPRSRRSLAALPDTCLGRAPASFRNAGAVRRPLGVPDNGVGEEDEALTDGPGAEGANGLLVAGLAEEALARPEHKRVDHQS